MTTSLRSWLGCAIAVVATGFVRAEEIVVQLDPAQTRVELTLRATMHTVHGTFRLVRGSIRFDPATGMAKGEVVVDARSGETGNSGRDDKMHKSVLESARYPEITFTPNRVEGNVAAAGQSRVQLHGVLRVHGADHDITLPVDAQITPGQVSAASRFEIPYVKWGMKDPSTFFLKVKDTVAIDVRAAGRLSAPAN